MITVPAEEYDRGPQRARTGSGTKPGVWVPWEVLEGACQLRLAPPSLWPVFLAVLGTWLRYGGTEARLEVEDLARLTGLGRRTVQLALAKLMKLGLIVRVRRGVLRVNLPSLTGVQQGAGMSAPPEGATGAARSAATLAPSKRKHACASPTSIDVSSSKEEVQAVGPFSAKQQRVIRDILAEASELLGEDASGLPLRSSGATTLGLPPGTTFGEAFKAIATNGTRATARDFTRLVLGLRQDERVQGRELSLGEDRT